MTTKSRLLTRAEAKMIAEELFELLQPACVKAAKTIAEKSSDEFLDINEAATFLRCSPSTLYKAKEKTGYTKFGNKLRFKKSSLILAMQQGLLKGQNCK